MYAKPYPLNEVLAKLIAENAKYLQVPYRVQNQNRVLLVNVYSITPAARKLAGLGLPTDDLPEKEPTFH